MGRGGIVGILAARRIVTLDFHEELTDGACVDGCTGLM